MPKVSSKQYNPITKYLGVDPSDFVAPIGAVGEGASKLAQMLVERFKIPAARNINKFTTVINKNNPLNSRLFMDSPIGGGGFIGMREHPTVKEVMMSKVSPTNKGLGTELYKEAMLDAQMQGKKGLASHPYGRNDYSNALWDKLHKLYNVTNDVIPEMDPRMEIDVLRGPRK